MNYVSLLLKKTFKNFLNIIPLILIIAFIVFIYVGSYYKASRDVVFSNEEIDLVDKDIAFFEEQVKKAEKGSEIYDINLGNLEIAKKRMQYLQDGYIALSDENWKAYYMNSLKLQEMSLRITKMDTSLALRI